MKILIIKLGAAGDVVRTTTLLHLFKKDEVDWITSKENSILLKDNPFVTRVVISDELIRSNLDEYDLVINLEDNFESSEIVRSVKFKELFGCYSKDNKLTYTDSSSAWFDLSLISKFGKQKADELKYENKLSFQELIFKGLGYEFKGEPYILPNSTETDLRGDIAISPKAGNRWPMKNWAYFDELADILKNKGFIVNFLPQRPSMLEHLSDLRNHKLLISGDSLPMHFALGSNVKCLTFFLCTSANEIYDYGIQTKLVSPLLKEFFYRQDFDERAVKVFNSSDVAELSLNLILNFR
jgi:heptosyltransferase-2